MRKPRQLLTRRDFAATVSATAALQAAEAPPNILWITCEDTGPHLGIYGDTYAVTPSLDRLAASGVVYRHAWSNAPVCAPARTAIISGLYPASTGSEHMRSMTRLPEGMKMYPCYLREAGYYVTNNSKEDYNLEHTGKVWDESNPRAHWRNRGSRQPFFAVFNFTITHESQIRTRPHAAAHDPAKVRVPAYHPDTPEVRQDWAQYYDNITTMDSQAGDVLRQLDEDGLAENTIVFFYGDHGSGMPRNKRWPYNCGLQVPLIVYIPEKYRHLAPPDYKPGGSSERLISFVDLAPTLLSTAGITPPAHMQGHAFLGKFAAPEQPYIYGFRGRMDERYDLVRSVRDKRYVYIRNYMPHKIYGQHIAYMFETPTTWVWKDLYDQGKLDASQRSFWEKKPAEELYDLQEDRDEVNNLAGSPTHRDILERMRTAQRDFAVRIRDVGFLPEHEIHSRSKGSTPYQMGRNTDLYSAHRVFKAADEASNPMSRIDVLVSSLSDADSAVRYWAALGVLIREQAGVKHAGKELRKALQDSSPSVRVIAAEALGRFGTEEDLKRVLPVLVSLASPESNGIYVSLLALNAIDALGPKASSIVEQVRSLPKADPSADPRMKAYAGSLIRHMALSAFTTSR